MTLELILWILAWLVIAEIIFIVSRKLKLWFNSDSWILGKICSLLISGFFMFMQLVIIAENCFISETPVFNYERLLYELGAIVVIAVYFGLNKLLVNWLDKK